MSGAPNVRAAVEAFARADGNPRRQTRMQKLPGRREAKALRRLAQVYYPLTLSGTVLFCLAVYLFARSLTTREPVGLFLSSVILLLLLLLALAARLQALRFGAQRIEWHSSTPLYSRFNRQQQSIEIDGARSWWFFRMHCVLRGRLACSSRSVLSVYKDASATRGDDFPLPIYLPFSGSLRCRCSLLVRDLFGLVRAGFGSPMTRTIPVRPPILTQQQLPPVYAAGGERETSRSRNPEEERYYMREYVPGDRFRDINWKASARISEIYTRISPLTQDRTQLITVYLRHFRPPSQRAESLESLVHLDFLKGWVLTFMHQVKRLHDEYQFRLVTAAGEHILETTGDIEEISPVVGTLHWVPEPPALFHDPNDRLVVVFTTPYDRDLSRFLQNRPQVEAHLFCTEAAGAASPAGQPEVQTVDVGYALLPGALPTRWIPLRDKLHPRLTLQSSHTWTVVGRQQLAVELFGPGVDPARRAGNGLFARNRTRKTNQSRNTRRAS